MEGRTLAWIVLAIVAGLFLSSLAGQGGGLFGTGMMSAMMWFWILLPIIVALALWAAVLDHRKRQEAPKPQAP